MKLVVVFLIAVFATFSMKGAYASATAVAPRFSHVGLLTETPQPIAGTRRRYVRWQRVHHAYPCRKGRTVRWAATGTGRKYRCSPPCLLRLLLFPFAASQTYIHTHNLCHKQSRKCAPNASHPRTHRHRHNTQKRVSQDEQGRVIKTANL